MNWLSKLSCARQMAVKSSWSPTTEKHIWLLPRLSALRKQVAAANSCIGVSRIGRYRRSKRRKLMTSLKVFAGRHTVATTELTLTLTLTMLTLSPNNITLTLTMLTRSPNPNLFCTNTALFASGMYSKRRVMFKDVSDCQCFNADSGR